MKKALIAAIIAAACAPALAGDYYIVAPVPGKTVTRANIQVTLAPVALQSARIGEAYSHNFKPLLQVTGDSNYSGSGVKWALAGGTLPPGLRLDSGTGVISGTPSAAGAWPFTLVASYLGKEGQQAYEVATFAGRILTLSPAIKGKTKWDLDSDGPLVLSTAGTWTITPASPMTFAVKLWGAGGGGGGYDGSVAMSGKGGGGAYVAGQYQAAANAAITAIVGGGGVGGESSQAARGAGPGGFNGGGAGSNPGPAGSSGGGGGGGGRTELLAGTAQIACAGGGGGGGGDGLSAGNGGNDGNYTTGTTATKTGGTPVNRDGDGGGHGGGGGGCNGGAAPGAYAFNDSNGEGGAAGASKAPLLANPTVQAPGTGGAPSLASDADLGPTNARGGINATANPNPGGNGTAGVIVIR